MSQALIAWRSIERGLERVDVDAARLAEDLDANWELLAEPIQTVMRRYGVENAYEQLKSLTRGQRIDAATMRQFIGGLAIPERGAKELLRALAGQLHRLRCGTRPQGLGRPGTGNPARSPFVVCVIATQFTAPMCQPLENRHKSPESRRYTFSHDPETGPHRGRRHRT